MSKNSKQTSQAKETTPSYKAKLARVWTTLIAVGAIGGFLGLVEKGWDILIRDTQPEISTLNISRDPFSLPFVLKNPSGWSAMSEVEWTCGIDRIESNGSKIFGLNLSYDAKTRIAQRGMLLVKCPIGNFDPSGDATIVPKVKYKTLWFDRTYDQTSFTWLGKANPPQWIPGSPLR